MSISEERKQRIQAKVGHLVEIMWDTAVYYTSDYKVSVRCLIDNDIQVRYVSDLNKGCYRCRECLKSKYRNIANINNFELLSFVVDKQGSFCILRCREDGEFLKVKTTNLLTQKKLHCQECRINITKQRLKLNNCIFIRTFTKDKRFAIVEYIDIDGVVRSASEQNILKESFAKTESHWDQHHKVYVITNCFNGKTYVKIGTANNPANRLKSLKLIGDVKVDIIGSFESRHDADKFEKELHRNYAEYRLPRCIPEEFTNGLSKVKTKMGITEWFSHEVLELMKENNGYTY